MKPLPPPDWDVTKCRTCGALPCAGCQLEPPPGEGTVTILFCRACWDMVVLPLVDTFADRIAEDSTFVARAEAAIDDAIDRGTH